MINLHSSIVQVPTTYSCDPFAVLTSIDWDYSPNAVTGITPAIPMPTSLDETLTITMSYTVNDGPIQTKELTFEARAATEYESSTGFKWINLSGGPTDYSQFSILTYIAPGGDYAKDIRLDILDEDSYINKFQCVSLFINGEPVTPRSN